MPTVRLPLDIPLLDISGGGIGLIVDPERRTLPSTRSSPTARSNSPGGLLIVNLVVLPRLRCDRQERQPSPACRL